MTKRLCPLRMTSMPSEHLKHYREQYECLGDECMWYVAVVCASGATAQGCAHAFNISNVAKATVNRAEKGE